MVIFSCGLVQKHWRSLVSISQVQNQHKMRPARPTRRGFEPFASKIPDVQRPPPMDVRDVSSQSFKMPQGVHFSSARRFQDHSPNSLEDVSLNVPKVLLVRATEFVREQKPWDTLDLHLWFGRGSGGEHLAN